MLPAPKIKIFEEFVQAASKEELIWMNGYISGILSIDRAISTDIPSAATAQVEKITVLYGTETGNSKSVATGFSVFLKPLGIKVKLCSADQYKLNDLSKEEFLVVIMSTQGEGEPPLSSKKFYDALHQQQFDLTKLNYAVLALGDSSYPLFCKAGEDIDLRLAALGAKRLNDLVKCDVDFLPVAKDWYQSIAQQLKDRQQPAQKTSHPKTTGSGKQYYTGTVSHIINLNDNISNKATYHIEIATDVPVHYAPGDALGIIPENPDQPVKEILHISGLPANTKVTFRNEDFNLEELFRKKVNIMYLPERTVRQYAKLTGHDIPDTKIGLLNLLKIYPLKHREQFFDLIQLLEPITPRLYSIASSPEAVEDEIHLTVALDTYTIDKETRYGLCSGAMKDWEPGRKVSFYIQKNHHFKLPDPDKPIIMIGPGTGIAPFRSFLSERAANGAEGKNWLFFGEQHFICDFLYQTEIQEWADLGVLTKVSLAFSRDQPYKLYVQHKILEEAREFWNWIDNGAYVYICGAKSPMSTDVQQTILQVIQRYGNKSSTEAMTYLQYMKEEGRYLLDVY